MHVNLARPRREQTQSEEIANSISHGIGLVAVLVGAPYLIAHAAGYGDFGFIVGASVFSATMALLYLASTLYHGLPCGRAKHVFRVIEHSAIFLLIAGTYTPFALGALRGTSGWTLFSIVWGIAAVGIVLRILDRFSHPVLFTGLYLLMGWVAVIEIDQLLVNVPAEGLFWLLAGGLLYTIGVVFFAADSWLHYGHLVWHLFVIAGTACHYFAVYWYAA